VLGKIVDFIGKIAFDMCQQLGKVGVFVLDIISTFFSTRLKIQKVLYQMEYIGVSSVGVVLLVGATIGAALALQSYIGLERYGATQFIGPIVFISMTREFGPVFTAIMVIGRAGSAITAELGTMRITEQIDALQTLCINPHQYLTVPRLVAGTLIMPFLSMFCSLFGIIAGYITSVHVLGVNPEIYTQAIIEYVELTDITNGLIKAIVFGFLVVALSIFKGYFVRGGAKGVGIAITQSVVYSILTVVVADYILTSLLFTR
jgi:phospholipid/cholesterol/gamma-HCH transport system permease protein